MAIPSEIIEFRKKAEKILNERVGKLSDFTDMDLQHLIEELQIYQIELELQNEELKLVRKEIEESCNKFFELYDSSPAAFVTVNRSNLDEIEAIYRSAPIGLCVFDRDHTLPTEKGY